MFGLGLGPTEVAIIAIIIAVVFGVGRLPEIGGAMGKTIKEFKRSVSDDDAQKAAARPAPAVAEPTPAPAPLPKTPEGREGFVRREEV